MLRPFWIDFGRPGWRNSQSCGRCSNCSTPASTATRPSSRSGTVQQQEQEELQDNPGRTTLEQLSNATNKSQPFKIEPPIPQAHAQFQAQMASRSTVHRRNGSSKSSQQHNYSLIPSISKLQSFGHHFANLENTSCLGVTLRSVS